MPEISRDLHYECSEAVYIGEIAHRLADYFREHLLDVLHNKGDLSVPQHFNAPGHSLCDIRVAVVKSGLVQRDLWQCTEVRHTCICSNLKHLAHSESTVIFPFCDLCKRLRENLVAH